MVFRIDRPSFDKTRCLYPWIDITIEDESIVYTPTCEEQNYELTQLILSTRNKIPYISQESLPWIKKLAVCLGSADEEDLPAISKLSGLTELEIQCNNDILSRLTSIGLELLPIKSLEISYYQVIERISINIIQDIFNLEKIITFQLHFLEVKKFPDYLEEQIGTVLSRSPNLQNISLIIPSIDFDHVMEGLKPNSLHALHLRIVQIDGGNETL